MQTLALKYRPRRFSDLVGQKANRLILEQQVIQNKVPTGLLFSGVRGTGKTTSGRILAAALNCTAEQKPCGECPHCLDIFAGRSIDVIEIDAASNGNIADIRQLIETLRYSVSGSKRVVLLDEAHSMSRDAFNALLKTLEEPPEDTHFVLLTTEPNKILETVLSRLMNYEFTRISTGDLVERLRYIAASEQLQVTDELILTIAERANGGMRDAIMTLDQVSRVGVQTVDQFTALLGESDFGPDLLAAMASGSDLEVFKVLDAQMVRTGDTSTIQSQMINTLVDIIKLRAGGEVPRQGEALEKRQRLTTKIDSQQAVAALRILWDLKTKVRAGDDPRALLELAVVMVTESLGRPKVAASTAPAPKKTMSLSDMRL